MTATDRIKLLPAIIPAAGTDGTRAITQVENNLRTERFNVRLTGQVDISVAGTALANRGALPATLTEIGFSDGGQDKVVLDGRLARFLAEMFSPSALPAVRLAAAGIQAATLLEEIVPIYLSAPQTINPDDTKYVEANKQLQLNVFINPNRLITRVASGPALVGTITALTARVEQVYDELLQFAPWLNAYTRQVVQDVTGTNPALKIDLRGTRWITRMAIQQDTDQGEDATILNAVVLRGDKKSVWGDRSIPFRDLQQAQAVEHGGAIPDAYLITDFLRYGRLTTSWNPYQDTNLRWEMDVQPSTVVGSTGSKIRCAMLEYEQTPATLAQLPYNF